MQIEPISCLRVIVITMPFSSKLRCRQIHEKKKSKSLEKQKQKLLCRTNSEQITRHSMKKKGRITIETKFNLMQFAEDFLLRNLLCEFFSLRSQ